MKQYPKYKESGIQWIGQVPEHWGKCRFKMLHSGTNVGESIDKKYWTENENDTVFYTAGAKPIRTDFRNFPKEKYTTENDLLLARNGTPYVYLPTIHAAYTDHIIRVSILGSVCKVYVSYALSVSITHESVDSVSLATWSASIWNAQELPLPPLSEQEAIAAYLDKQTEKIDKSIESLEQQKTDLQQYRTSLISEAVTRGLNPNTTLKDSGVQWIGQIPEEWKVSKLKNIAIFINGFAFDSKLFGKGSSKVIRIGDIQNEVSYDTCTTVADSSEYKPFMIQKDDVLVAMSGATTGKCCIVKEVEKAYINQRVGIIRSNFARFIYYSIQTQSWRTHVDLKNAGSAQPNISSEAIMNFQIPIPQISEMIAIAAYLDEQTGKIDTAIATIDQQIADFRAYRTALITEAVTGKVDVR